MSPSTAPSRPPTPAIEAAAADWVTRCDAGLTTAEQQIFQDWLGADARHADAFDRLSEAWSVFDRVQEGGVISAVLNGLAKRARQRRTRRLQAAAAVAIILFAGLWYVQLAEPALEPVREGRGQLAVNDRIRRLPDGSVVELNAGAAIAVHYEADARRVTLVRGEAFFRVAKDATRPFFVETHGITVRAVGTAFSVQAKATAVEIFVKEGAVDVGHTQAPGADAAAPGPGSDPQVVRVNAGKRFVALIKLIPAKRLPATAPAPVRSAEDPQPVTEEEMEKHLAWRDTRQEFNGTTLDEAVAVLNRQNLTQIIIKDPAVGRLRVDGYFRSDNPEGFVRIVEGSFDLKAEELAGHTILLRARP